LRPFDQSGTQGVSLGVTADRDEVLIALDRKAFESSLVDVPLTGGMGVGAVTHGVGGCHPTEKLAHRPILLGSQHQVPMVGHQLVTVQLDFVQLESLGENSLEGLEVFVFVENSGPTIATVQGMIVSAGFIGSWWSGHPGNLTDSPAENNES
jgi:hypothetical protein